MMPEQSPNERRWPKTLVRRGERVGSSRPDYVWWHELPDDTTAESARSVGYEVVEVMPVPPNQGEPMVTADYAAKAVLAEQERTGHFIQLAQDRRIETNVWRERYEAAEEELEQLKASSPSTQPSFE